MILFYQNEESLCRFCREKWWFDHMIWSNYTQKLASWKGNLFISGKSRWRWHIIPFGRRWLSSFWIKQHLKLNKEHKKKHIACLISLSKCFFVFRLPIFWSFPIWLLKKIHGRVGGFKYLFIFTPGKMIHFDYIGWNYQLVMNWIPLMVLSQSHFWCRYARYIY